MAGSRRSLWKMVRRVLLGLVAVVALAFVVLVIVTNRTLAAEVPVVSVAPVRLPAPGDAAAVERGRYLVDHAFNCKVCHAADFGGRAEVDTFVIGHLWGPNLTTGEGSATRDFSLVDWSRAIRHGQTPTGRRLILMPSEDFTSFSDDDIGAVVAYIRSVPPVDRADQGIRLGPLGRVLLATGQVGFAFDKIDHTAVRSVAVPGATLAWGEVLSTACTGCHGSSLSGGPIVGGDPSWPPAANLTPHATGIGAWTLADFTTALRQGHRPDGTAIRPPMPWQAYSGLTDADIEALWLRLRAVPAVATVAK